MCAALVAGAPSDGTCKGIPQGHGCPKQGEWICHNPDFDSRRPLKKGLSRRTSTLKLRQLIFVSLFLSLSLSLQSNKAINALRQACFSGNYASTKLGKGKEIGDIETALVPCRMYLGRDPLLTVGENDSGRGLIEAAEEKLNALKDSVSEVF